MSDKASVSPGSRVRCSACGSEAIVTVAGSGASELSCCEAPLEVVVVPTAPAR